MNKSWLFLSLFITVIGATVLPRNLFRLNAEGDVTVKLVLGDQATLPGFEATDDEVIYHHNVVSYTAPSGTVLPSPIKEGATFTAWVYAENARLMQATVMPLSSGAVYYAYFGSGTLATSSQNSSSSESSSSSSGVTSSTISSENSSAPDQVTLYLDVALWSLDNPIFYVYTFNAETAGAWPGVAMAVVVGTIYQATIPTGFSSVIFSRYSSNGTLWNQTVDLTYNPVYNLFTIASWNNGTWSNYNA